jgi:hypothetical protein
MLLLLAKGRKTIYFGDISNNIATIKQYFSCYRALYPPKSNPAKHIINIISREDSLYNSKDWNKTWLKSPKYN